MSSTAKDLHFMELALEEAKKALLHDDIPVGAVLVRDDQVIATGKNERELLHSPTAHAEVQAINKAAEILGHWNLTGSKLYITLEPCVMCAGALVQARVEEIIYAAEDFKGGSISLEIAILDNLKLNHRVKVRRGPLAEESSALLKSFFKQKRKEKNTSGKKE